MTGIATKLPQAGVFPGPYLGSGIQLGAGGPEKNPSQVGFQIAWFIGNTGFQAYPNNCISINLVTGSSYPINRILSLYVDNLSSQSPTLFVFPDTGFRFICPAFTDGFFPVVTNGLTFTVFSPEPVEGDVTNVIAMNIPASTALSSEQIPGVQYRVDGSTGNIAPLAYPRFSTPIAVTADGTHIILPSPTDTVVLAGFSIQCSFINGGGSPAAVSMILEDISGLNVYWRGSVSGRSGTLIENPPLLANIAGLQISTDGLQLVTASVTGAPTYAIFCNVYFDFA